MQELGNVICNLLVFFALLALVILGLRSQYIKGNEILETWADENSYKIIKREYKFIWNIFEFPALKGQPVYHVTVVDKNGIAKSGLVRCGHWFWGTIVNTAFVKWDK